MENQRARTGGTPYRCAAVHTKLDSGLALSAASLNALRRQALEELSAQRVKPRERRTGDFQPGVRYENRREAPVLTVSVRHAEQITDELLALNPALIYVPAEELAAHPDLAGKGKFGVILPRIAWDKERDTLKDQLKAARDMGVKDALVGNLGLLDLPEELGFTLRGDFGLELYNSQALKEVKRMGLASATVSFELKLAQIRDLSKALDTELITYGRLPLMIMENCIIRNRTGGVCRHACEREGENTLTDRKGEKFPVVRAWGCRNEILNGKPVYLADKAGDYRRLGLWAQRLMFTLESPKECAAIARRYAGSGDWTPSAYTRGLYYRDVE